MTRRQLETRARSEWQVSRTVRRLYPTYSHYWRERYARVYGLGARDGSGTHG
jgi:hypothetical protein